MTIIEAARAVTGGIDIHGEVHVAAVLDEIGGLRGTQSFRADPDGYAELLAWLEAFGEISKVGVEGTGSYGAGIAPFLAKAGVHVLEVDRQNRQARHRAASPIPSTRSRPPGRHSPGGPMERPRAGRFGRSDPGPRRGQTLGPRGPDQGARPDAPVDLQRPDQLQSRLKGLPIARFVAAAQGLGPTRSPDVVTSATKASLFSLAHRVTDLEEEISDLDAMITPLLESTAPELLGTQCGANQPRAQCCRDVVPLQSGQLYFSENGSASIALRGGYG